MWALDGIVKSGKALYIGLSNYDGDTMEKAASILGELHCLFIINVKMSKGVEKRKSPLCKGRWVCEANSEGLQINQVNNPSVNFVDSSLYTREPLKELHLKLMPRNVEFY